MARGAEGEARRSSGGARLLAGTVGAIVLVAAGTVAWLVWTEPPPQPPKPLLTMPLPSAPPPVAGTVEAPATPSETQPTAPARSAPTPPAPQ